MKRGSLRLRRWHWPGCVGLALASLALVGCGDEKERLPVFPVSGQLLINGKPAEGALVVFHPESGDPAAPRPQGTAGKDGRYTLTTYVAGDGAPAGKYKVTLSWQKMIVKQKGEEPELGPNLAPKAFLSPASTTLTATVAESPNDLPLTATGQVQGGPAVASPTTQFSD